jgi:hypothetical protein
MRGANRRSALMSAADAPPKIWLPQKPAIMRPGPRIELVDFRCTFPMPFFVPRSSNHAVRAHCGITAGSVSGTNFTFSSVALGTAVGTSLVVVIAYVISTGNSVTISSVSIDGTNGTIHVQAQDIDGGFVRTSRIGIASRATSNTSGTIVVNNSASNQGAAISVYRLTKLTSATPDDVSGLINVSAHGLVLAGGCSTEAGPTSALGVTQNGSTTPFGASSIGRAWSGSAQNLNAETNRAVGPGYAGSGAITAVTAAASWH